MSEYTILPLINASFQPGEAKRTVAGFEDRDFQKIARAEYYYFTGQAEKCSHIAERYLMSHNIKLKMSSCLLYVYSNLTLGRAVASRKGILSRWPWRISTSMTSRPPRSPVSS